MRRVRREGKKKKRKRSTHGKHQGNWTNRGAHRFQPTWHTINPRGFAMGVFAFVIRTRGGVAVASAVWFILACFSRNRDNSSALNFYFSTPPRPSPSPLHNLSLLRKPYMIPPIQTAIQLFRLLPRPPRDRQVNCTFGRGFLRGCVTRSISSRFDGAGLGGRHRSFEIDRWFYINRRVFLSRFSFPV